MSPPHVSLSEVGHRNTVYSEAEQIVIKNALKTTEACLLRLGTLRSNSAARRHQLKDQIYRCKLALSPYKKIPREIYLYIFELCCQSSQLSTCVIRPRIVVLTQVCSAWRQIALSMPKLWSDVHMGEGFNLARMWLGRAGNIPRALKTTYYFSSHRHQTIQSFLCSFPFKKLHLTECDTARMDFTAIPVESLLLLEDFALLTPAWDWECCVTSFSPHHFPNLVSLRIETSPMPHFHVSRPFSTWKKLRVLQLECNLDKARCLEILSDAPSVEDCSLRLMRTSYNSQGSTIENTVLANLKIFRLTFWSTSTLWSFLDHLTLQNLHTLILINPTGFSSYHLSPLLYRAQRIGSLRSLDIHRLYVNIDVGLILEWLPLLRVLNALCEKITTHTAEKIGRGELGGCLRELHDWSYHNLYEFLQACEIRRDVTQGQCTNSSETIAHLEKVSVRYYRELTDCEGRIRELHKDGVKFEVCQGSKKVLFD